MGPARSPAGIGPIAAGFALGSPCFLIGPFPGVVQLVGPVADAVMFFVGSILFTFAASLELRQGTLRRGARFGAGTLLFNVDTYDAMQTGLSSHRRTG